MIKQTRTIPLIELVHSNKENERSLGLQVINISTKEKLKKMGAKAKKSLPEPVLKRAEEGEEL